MWGGVGCPRGRPGRWEAGPGGDGDSDDAGDAGRGVRRSGRWVGLCRVGGRRVPCTGGGGRVAGGGIPASPRERSVAGGDGGRDPGRAGGPGPPVGADGPGQRARCGEGRSVAGPRALRHPRRPARHVDPGDDGRGTGVGAGEMAAQPARRRATAPAEHRGARPARVPGRTAHLPPGEPTGFALDPLRRTDPVPGAALSRTAGSASG